MIPSFQVTEEETTSLNEIHSITNKILESRNFSKGEISRTMKYLFQSEKFWINWKVKMCKMEEKLPDKDIKDKLEIIQREIYPNNQAEKNISEIAPMELPEFIQDLDKAPICKNRLDLGPRIVPKPKIHFDAMDAIMSNPDLATSEELQAKFELERWKAIRSTIFEKMNISQKELSRDLKEFRQK
ncbi:hypothetical protein BB561_000252 [Smittium simulii]|uniref:Uncharacterized protein n=1 Tax=Smittium simulii TaxID=133385 RepID=A0A2T9YZU6_9FUNG|nr:hypothetical protein BB561_000252 [Smittium simulii]